MEIADNILKYYLRNVRFITGTAYAGKSTMVAMLAEKYNLVFCGENFHDVVPRSVFSRELQPNLCYFDTMSGWQEFVNRTPEVYSKWIRGVSEEVVQVEIPELIKRSQDRIVIADTNIPISVLKLIADYNQVAVMLSPQSMSVERFFDRDDPEKRFTLDRIMEAEDPEKTMANFRACMAMINSKEVYDEYANSGFFTLVREDLTDTRQEVLAKLAKHFGLE